MEPAQNIIKVCADCKEAELKMFQDNLENELNEMEQVIAKGNMAWIKTGFDIINEDSQEHMWVIVEEVDREKKVIRGRLDNEPESDVGYEHKDEVEISFDKIENAMWPGRQMKMPQHIH